MFDDPKAERLWRRYRLRAELMLGPVAQDVRKQILEDLDAHMRDAAGTPSSAAREFEAVTETLARLGDPQEFIGPLLAEAVLKRRPDGAGPGASLRAIADYAVRGGAYLRRAALIIGLGVSGAAMATLALASLLRPGLAGVYILGADEIQVRLFGLSGSEGAPLFAPWLELALGLIGAGFLLLAWRLIRRTVSELLAQR